jgi:AcrR family transcriptional regulator
VTTPPNRTDHRVRLPRDARRATLLEAALAAFSENGYHATSMDDIAERAGVSKPVLYQHFDSKLELYLALAARVADDVVATITRSLDSTSDNGARIAACARAYFEFVDRPASGYRLVFASDMGADPAVAAVLDDARSRCAEAIGRVLRDQTALGWTECVLLGTTLVGMVQSAARQWFEGGSSIPLPEAAELVTTLAWRGIAHYPQVDEQPPS